MLAISTAWNYRPDIEMRQLLLEIKETGLNAVELGYKLTVPQLEQIVPLLKELNLNVSSVHNFCPLPDDHPSPRHPSNYYRLTALDEAERALAVRWTKTAVDTAVRVGAPVVVIHAGTVEMPDYLSEKLFKSYKVSNQGAGAFDQVRQKFIDQRKAARGPYMDAIIKSLTDVLSYAQDHDIKIGLETRYYPTEIPNDEEIGELLLKFHCRGLWYWHDVGHAEANDRLGIYDHQACLRRYADQLIGFHLHGVKILRDHHAPLEGDFDIKQVYPFIKKQHIKVIESHGSATLAQIRCAVDEFSKLEQ
jgi:sugar phosphate isomerase/epimerase